jgi:cbb3-type cytochrome oxidase subunit 3
MALAVEIAAAIVLAALILVIICCIWIMTRTASDEWP